MVKLNTSSVPPLKQTNKQTNKQTKTLILFGCLQEIESKFLLLKILYTLETNLEDSNNLTPKPPPGRFTIIVLEGAMCVAKGGKKALVLNQL